ncbi:MAG: hypothetical protein M1428_02755, partial [Deltaproteobacteria bacterium]|nr:hypothetical protein [Deltaproteobacteria bacterium]
MSGDYWSTIRGGGITSFFGSGSGQLYNYNSGIAYTSTDGITSWFNTESERITAQTDGAGAAKYYNYDSYGKLVSVNDSVGRTVLYGYANTTSTLINTITDPNGNAYRLNYDSYNHLTQIIYPNSSTKQLSYDSNGQLTSIVDENGNMASYAYNSGGTLAAYYGPSGFGTFQVVNVGAQNINGQSCNGTAIIYDISNVISPQYWWLKNNLVNSNQPVIEQFGNVQLCKECGIVAGIPWAGVEGIQWSGYDSLGNLISQTDYNENLTTWYGYDYNGDYQTMTTACGSPVSSIYGTPYSSTTEYTWNTRLHQPTSIITKSVLVNKSGPNQANKVTYYNYNSANELLSITQTGYTFNSYGNIAGYSYTTFYSYDNADNLTGISDSNGSATHYNRDSMGNITSIANALNQTTYYSNYDNMGHTGTVTDPNGNVSNITYNWRGQVTSITQKAASSTGTDLTTNFSYNVKGNVSEITYPSGAYILYTYDAGDHVTNITRYNSLGQTFGSIAYTYDFKGNKTSENVYDAQSNLVRFRDYIYDQYDTLAKSINGYTSTTYYDHDGNGNLSSKTDSNGNLINYQYNELNKLGRVVQYLGSPYDPYGSQTNALTTYMYNLHGDLITVTDANDNNSNYTYDDLGRLVEVNSPDTGITRYWYDANGNLIGKVDADGRTLNYTYDELNRLTNVIDISNPKNAIVTYYYDGQNPLNISITNGIGRLTGMHDSSGNTAYSYDARGNVIQETRSISGHTFVTSYNYDNDGNIASMTYPSGRVVNYTYAADPNKPSSVSAMVNDVNTTIASNITYQPFADLAGLTYGNGLSLTITTDVTGEITNIQVGNIINRAYSSDNAGNILTITTTPSSYTYSYDALNRVTDSTGDYGDIEYSYDLVGNRLTQVTSTKTINYVYYLGTNKLWSYNDPPKGGNENNIKWQYKRLIERWEHLIENGEDRRCIEHSKDSPPSMGGAGEGDSYLTSPSTGEEQGEGEGENYASVIARNEATKQSFSRHSRENGNPEKDSDNDHREDKTCYTYVSLANAMLGIASKRGIDLQTFAGLLIQSNEIKTDISDIVNRVNQRGVNAVLEKQDIKLFKHLFEDMEEAIKNLNGLNPADPIFSYDAAGYIIGESVSGMQLQYDSLGRLTQVSETITQGSSGPGNKVTTTVTTIGQYTYDGMNRRITKTTGGTTTIFLYDIYNNLIGEYDASTGNTNKEYIYLGSKPLAMITDPVSSSSSGCGSINTGCSTIGLSLRNGYSMKTGMGAVDGFIYLFPLIGIAIIRIGKKAKRRKLDIIGLLTIGGMVILIVMVSRQTHAQVSGETVYY